MVTEHKLGPWRGWALPTGATSRGAVPSEGEGGRSARADGGWEFFSVPEFAMPTV